MNCRLFTFVECFFRPYFTFFEQAASSDKDLTGQAGIRQRLSETLYRVEFLQGEFDKR